MSDQSQFMRECEARTWLRKGYTSQEKVAELEKLLAAKRGKNAAQAVIEEMRRQWSRRSEWLHG